MRDWLLLCVLALFVTDAVAVAQEKAQRRQAEPARQQALHVQPGPIRYRTYRIRKGDSLASIAKRTMGRTAAYREILKANPGLKPSAMRVGQVIRLPRGAPRPATAQSPDAARALRRARQMIQAAERSTDPKAAQRALDEAEKSLMEARKALWREQQKQRQGKGKKSVGVVRKQKANAAAKEPRAGIPIGTFFEVFSGPF